jgi:hypothetical protein
MKIEVLNSLAKYEQLIAPARERFAARPGIRAIQASSVLRSWNADDGTRRALDWSCCRTLRLHRLD